MAENKIRRKPMMLVLREQDAISLASLIKVTTETFSDLDLKKRMEKIADRIDKFLLKSQIKEEGEK